MVKLLSLISGLLQSAQEPECAAPVPAAAWDFIVPDCDLRQGGNQSRINISKFSRLGENVSNNHQVPSQH